MSKPPPNLPSVGDNCKLRGRKSLGVLKSVGERLWASVDWDEKVAAGCPKLCHLHELEKVV